MAKLCKTTSSVRYPKQVALPNSSLWRSRDYNSSLSSKLQVLELPLPAVRIPLVSMLSKLFLNSHNLANSSSHLSRTPLQIWCKGSPCNLYRRIEPCLAILPQPLNLKFQTASTTNRGNPSINRITSSSSSRLLFLVTIWSGRGPKCQNHWNKCHCRATRIWKSNMLTISIKFAATTKTSSKLFSKKKSNCYRSIESTLMMWLMWSNKTWASCRLLRSLRAILKNMWRSLMEFLWAKWSTF